MLHNWALRRTTVSAVSPPPAANQVAWFRKGIGQVGGANCSQWTDQSGLNHHLLQGTGAAQPAIQGDGTLLFDGASHFMKCTGFTLTQPTTLYLRMRQVTWTSNRYFTDGNSVNTGVILQSHTGATPQIEALADMAGASYLGPNGALTVNVYASVCAVFNGASSVLQVGATTVSGTLGTDSMGGFTLGAASLGVAFSNIQVAEGILYNVAHDASTRAAVIAYLNTL